MPLVATTWQYYSIGLILYVKLHCRGSWQIFFTSTGHTFKPFIWCMQCRKSMQYALSYINVCMKYICIHVAMYVWVCIGIQMDICVYVRLNEDVNLYICMALMIKSVLALVVVLLLLSLPLLWLLLLPLLLPILLLWLWLWFLLLSQLLLPLCICICSHTRTSQYVHVFAYGPKIGAAFLRFSFRVPSATEWTAMAHTVHMPKPVITFVFQALRNGLLWYILYTCPNLW